MATIPVPPTQRNLMSLLNLGFHVKKVELKPLADELHCIGSVPWNPELGIAAILCIFRTPIGSWVCNTNDTIHF
jgi:hypothetical protein